VKYLRESCTGRRPVHLFNKLGVAVGLALTVAPLPLLPASALHAQARPSAEGQGIDNFYHARHDAPLWFAAAAGDAADKLVGLLATSSLDGLQPDQYHTASLQAAILSARGGKPKDVLKADKMLSQAFVAYVDDMARDPGVGVTYVDSALRPTPPSPRAALLTAAAAPSLSKYLADIGWMNPIYGQLRHALASNAYSDSHERDLIALNLQRARALPAGPQRYILVNAAQQRLYMYDNGKPVDSMVVVVGKPKWATPMMTAYIRYAALNPYWYVPPDLAGEDVAQFVVKRGLSYLDDYGYEIVSDWSPNPTIIDPKTVDWQGVVDGKVQINIRQKPGPKNFMGRIKFMFPNQFGVYLHDNPRRDLFKESTRYFSGGCVRLEDAWRLSKWLFGRDLTWEGAGTEEPVPLAQPVPVYITYLTAMPDGSSVAFYDDAYDRDTPKLAVSDAQSAKADAGR
jgi:murein L,D-transpeptidase YcbB/YkuD